MHIVFVDDSRDARRQWVELCQFENWKATCVESVAEAMDIVGDWYFIDITTVSAILALNYAFGPISMLMDRHPGAQFAIMSAISRNSAESVIDDVEDVTGIRPFYVRAGYWEDFQELINRN